MNTLNYIGCKHTLLSCITNLLKEHIPNLDQCSFMDLFAGTGTVSYGFTGLAKSIASNDLEYYSFVINNALIKCNYSDKLQTAIDTFNQLEPVEGLMYKNYSPGIGCERLFFTIENAKKCDAIRQRIQILKETTDINEQEYYFLLGSLIVSMDKVANTSCVYGAYLKAFKKSALKPLNLVPIHTKTDIDTDANTVFNCDANTLIDQYYDDVYMDPPYNQRQYSANYCPLNYLAKYEDVELKGKTGLLTDYNKSNFCKKTEVLNAFKRVLQFNCKYLVLSYNNEGLLDLDILRELLLSVGDTKLFKIPYKKFKAQQTVDGDSVYEYLWIVDKSSSNKPFSFYEEYEV